MHEILLPLISGVVRSFLGLFEILGFFGEADYSLTGGLFSAKTLVTVRDRMRRRRAPRRRTP